MNDTHKNKHTHLVANIHQCCPQCFLLLSTASRCHIEKKLGSCWTAGSRPGCPHVKYTNTRTHTLCLHTNIHSLMYTQKRWQTLTAAGMPQFSDRPTEDCWLYTHTTVQPTGLELLNLCNIKHKHAHKPTGMQIVRREEIYKLYINECIVL